FGHGRAARQKLFTLSNAQFVSLLYSFPLHFRAESLHIPAMAKSPKKSPDPNGFEEAPQSSFEGAPLYGSVADWVKQLEA
ncbi:hypothetical protein, partial [Rhizobium leguminosarum]|uniref:hypothetical protein n=1 Tax=Rhizobium leguminosarum TaxID=384 RepID=UPI003F968C33